MTKYILRRVLFFVPTLFIITLLAFTISVNAPGDPVERMMSSSQTGEQQANSVNTSEQKLYWRKKLGLDLPLFYFSMNSLSVPDTLYKIYDKQEREALERLIDQYGNWKEISLFHQSILSSQNFIHKLPGDSLINKQNAGQIEHELTGLKYKYDDKSIETVFSSLDNLNIIPGFSNTIDNLKSNYAAVKSKSSPWKNYVPAIRFYGNNQYHRWLFGDGTYSKGILKGDFGISYVTRQPVAQVIGEKFFWTFFFAITSVIIAYLISIPVGIKAGAKKDSAFDRVSSIVLFILYSLPAFWVATLLLMTFANTDMLYLFPASGVKPAGGYSENATLFEKIKLSLPYLILPTICYTYSSFAFLSRTMRVAMLEEVSRDYIRTARAKGLPESKVIYKHAFRNALFPAITVFANVFPALIGGSVILETIFTIPGMGFETVSAIHNQNYPMIIAIFTITGILTLIGYLISDILYAFADPRISFSTSKE